MAIGTTVITWDGIVDRCSRLYILGRNDLEGNDGLCLARYDLLAHTMHAGTVLIATGIALAIFAQLGLAVSLFLVGAALRKLSEPLVRNERIGFTAPGWHPDRLRFENWVLWKNLAPPQAEVQFFPVPPAYNQH